MICQVWYKPHGLITLLDSLTHIWNDRLARLMCELRRESGETLQLQSRTRLSCVETFCTRQWRQEAFRDDLLTSGLLAKQGTVTVAIGLMLTVMVLLW
ncbi:hypothetical protein BR93DRAFT_922918 [Coniochaeta sp. PMI_546]|nr:hypothetical protein BR93DRAFT_922918 [Coniochaeta sp. PMI_546]